MSTVSIFYGTACANIFAPCCLIKQIRIHDTLALLESKKSSDLSPFVSCSVYVPTELALGRLLSKVLPKQQKAGRGFDLWYGYQSGLVCVRLGTGLTPRRLCILATVELDNLWSITT